MYKKKATEAQNFTEDQDMVENQHIVNDPVEDIICDHENDKTSDVLLGSNRNN